MDRRPARDAMPPGLPADWHTFVTRRPLFGGPAGRILCPVAPPLTEPCRFPSGAPKRNGKVRVAARAGEQFGRIHARQLRRLGVRDATIFDWKKTGYLLPANLPGVYAVGHRAPSVEGDLSEAILYAGEGAMLSHATALWWYGILDHRPFRTDVTTPGRAAPQRRIKVHARRQLKRSWHHGLPITSVAQALLDFAASAPFNRVRYAVAQAEHAELLDLQEIEGILGRGKPGSATLRRALQNHLPQLARTRSELERVFLPLCERGRIPIPEVNVTVNGVLADAVWRESRVVVMLDGNRGHRTRAQIEKDRRDDLRLRAAGYTVLRYTWDQITKEPDTVLPDIQLALFNPPELLAAPGSH
jgi:hypothetical protein